MGELGVLSVSTHRTQHLSRFSSHKSLGKFQLISYHSSFRRSTQSLLLHVLQRKLKVHSCAIGYLEDRLIRQIGISSDEIKENLVEGLPFVAAIDETTQGNVATIILPRFESEIFGHPEELQAELTLAFKLADSLGAKCVSLTGLLASATQQGHEVKTSTTARPTTGHATTTACVVLTIEDVLKQAARDMTSQSLCCLGLGSIGFATLKLLLRALPHPKKITLVDVFGLERLESIKAECRRLGFKGAVDLCPAKSGDMVPDEVYECNLMVGAVNTPNVVDVHKLRPGTVIVDDSAPHCFDVETALSRFKRQGDIIFTEGGKIRLPNQFTETYYFPKRWEVPGLPSSPVTTNSCHPEQGEMMGCMFSSLLSSLRPDLPPTIGIVDVATCERHFKALKQMGCRAARPSCDDHMLDMKAIISWKLMK